MKKRNLYVADAVWNRLKALAERDGMNVSEVIRQAIIEFLKREEKNG